MGRISVLDPEVSGRIAAGEVIERPASVVKELCENALDAGSHRVVVEIWDGGLQRIRVTDDGEGMDAEDAAVCLLRHATSKLRRVEDLIGIETLGFRGEALPSIAAVARLELRTRRADQDGGTLVSSAGGSPPVLSPAGGPPGTVVDVSDLFFNLPARRQALQGPSRSSAGAAIFEVVSAEALARPDVAFTFCQDGREILATPGSGDLRATAAALWGAEVAATLLPVDASASGWRFTGLIAPPTSCRGNRSWQYLAVEGRPVRPTAIQGVVEAAYRGLLMVHRYPVYAVDLSGPDGEYDVNVHPSKREVRLRNEGAVRALVHRAVTATLRTAELVPDLPVQHDGPAVGWRGASEDRSLFDTVREEPIVWERTDPAPLAPTPRIPQLEPLGQIRQSFLVARGEDGLYVIDQHAAHERVFFERLQAEPSAVRERLVTPALVELSLTQWAIWQKAAEAIKASGYTVEEFGSHTLLVRAVPSGFSGPLTEVLDRWEVGGQEDPVRRAHRALAACKAAVKAGQALTPEDCVALLADLSLCTDPFTCPHGRPTFLRLGTAELERHFGRH